MTQVLMIPGNMCDERLWTPVAERLSAAGHPVRHAPRLDQPSIEAMAEAVAAGIERPTAVLGFSMGAIVATEMARRAPERIAGLALIAFNATADLPERSAVRPRQQSAVREGRLEEIVADELKPNYLAHANRRDSRLLGLIMQMARSLGPEVFVTQSEALRRRTDLRPALPGLTMPVALACGSEDRLCPPNWHRQWAALIGPHARVAEIPGAGHLLPLERPDELAHALIDWLAEDVLCPTIS